MAEKIRNGDVYSVVMYRVDSVVVSDICLNGDLSGNVKGRVIRARVSAQSRRVLGLATSQSHGVFDFRMCIEKIVCAAKQAGEFHDRQPESESDDAESDDAESESAA